MARRRRRGLPSALAAARIHGCPDVVSTMWILLMLFGALGGVLCYPPWGAAPVPPEPVQVMTDVTNHLGVALLQDFACLPGNVAFSPYGAASVLIVLWEGARGESGVQLRKALGLPSSSHPTLDYGVIRLGMRDIHRHLRSYFAHDGYLNGLTFGNTSAASLKPSFKQVLRFYGYDPDTAMSGGEMATPPWMKHMTTAKPLNVTQTTESKMDENNTTTATTTPLTLSTLSSASTEKPSDVLPPIPSPTVPISSNSKPSKTTKSAKLTTQKLVPTTEMTQSGATTELISSTVPNEATTTLTSTSHTTDSSNIVITSPSTQNITSTTLKDFKETSVPSLTDITDYTSSTRVTRRMPTGEMASEAETNIPSTPTLVTIKLNETPEAKQSTTQNIMSAIPADSNIPVRSTTQSAMNTPSLSSMLTALSGGKASDSGITTTFILMTMTTKEFQRANLTSLFPQSLNLVTNKDNLPSTSPLPAESLNLQPTSEENISEGSIDELVTDSGEKETITTVPTVTDEIEVTEVSAQTTTEMNIIDEALSSESTEDFIYTTTLGYETTTTSSDNSVENMTLIDNAELTTPLDLDVMTTTEMNDNDMTESTTIDEEISTLETSSQPPEEDVTKNSRKKRKAEGENDDYPEIQLHLHGNAMMNTDDKDMDALWQKYQEKFGLPLGPFRVGYPGHEPMVKWIPMIRIVKPLPVAYISRLQAQTLMLPLDDERYKLLLILPVEDNNGNEGWRPSRQIRSYPFQSNGPRDLTLLRLIEDLRSVPLREVISSVQTCIVAATFPPFLIKGLLDLTPSLVRMGVKDVFDVKSADLSGMSNSTNLWVRGVEQTVSVAIDVNGIFGRNGAAVNNRRDGYGAYTGQNEDKLYYQGYPENHGHQRRDATGRQGYWGSSIQEDRVDVHFMATRPFLFFVVDTSTRVALMAGKVIDPTSTKNAR